MAMRKILLLTFTLALTMLALRADIIPTLSTVSPTGSNFTWNYSTNVTVEQMVRQGDFFTIYDFGNFSTGSNLQPANWTFSSSLVGTNPALVTPADNGSILNLTWTYNGTTAIDGSALIGIFSVVA